MSPSTAKSKTLPFRMLAVFAALLWVGAEVAEAGQGRAGSSRSVGSKSSSSSSSASSSSSSSSRGSGGSQRTAVSRAPSSSKSSAARSGSARTSSSTRRGGAARTRTNTRPQGGRGGGSSHRYGGYYGGGYYSNPYYWTPWGYWGWGLGFGHGYGYYNHNPVVYSHQRGYRMGALDLKVRPKNSEVYVDGQYVGLAKQFDGFPGHLWLEKGVYEVALYRPGFETETRTVRVMTNLILDVEANLQVGEAIQPEMRLRPEEVRPENEEPVRSSRFSRGDYQSRLHVDVEPRQALIYLDGNVLGTADELAGLHAGLILSAGRHTLEVVHRGYESVERSILVEPGEEIDFALELQPEASNASP